MTTVWVTQKQKLDELVKKFEFYKEKIKASEYVGKLVSIREDIQPYLEMKRIRWGPELESQGLKSLEKGVKTLNNIEYLFDKKVISIGKKIKSKFNDIYKSKIKVKDLNVLEDKKKNLYEICTEYKRLQDLGFINKEYKIEDKNISNFFSFYNLVSTIDKNVENLKQKYSKSTSKAELLVILNDTESAIKRYSDIAKAFKPSIWKKHKAYSCDFNIKKASEFAIELKETIKNYNDIVEQQNTIIRKIKLNKQFVEKLNKYYKDPAIRNYFTNEEIIGAKKNIPQTKYFNDTIKELILQYQESLKDLNDTKSGILDYVNKKLNDINNYNTLSSLDEAFGNIENKRKGINHLKDIVYVIGEQNYNPLEKALNRLLQKEKDLNNIKHKRELILQDIVKLQNGDVFDLNSFKYEHDKNNPYLRDLANEYEFLVRKIEDKKEQDIEKLNKLNKNESYDQNFNLPLHIERLGTPDNENYYEIRNILFGMWDKNWTDRFKRLDVQINKLKPAKSYDDIDYLKRLQFLIEKSTRNGLIAREVKHKKENAIFVHDAIKSLEGYINKSENYLMSN